MAPPKRVNIPMPPNLMPLAEVQGRIAMRNILLSKECQEIAFNLGSVQINGALFSLVAAGLWGIDRSPPKNWAGGRGVAATQYRPITTSYWCKFGMTSSVSLSASGALMATKGEYDPETNTFTFPFGGTGSITDVDDEGTVVHECVHAGLDAAQFKVKALDDESAARVAQQWYRRSKMGSNYTLKTDVDMMFSIIATIAMNANPKPYTVPDEFLRQMRATLQARGYDQFKDTDMSPADGVAPLGGLNLAVTPVGKSP
jgi:hypothetical protein